MKQLNLCKAMRFLPNYSLCLIKLLYKKKKQKIRNWSDLPHDILLVISSKLSSSFDDISSLERVCSSWRIAIRNDTTTSYPVLPIWLPDTKEKFVCIIKPRGLVEDAQYNPSGRVIGSRPDGWVILTDQILNPYLDIQMKLPNITDTKGPDPGDGTLIPEDFMSKAAILTFSFEPDKLIVAMSFHYCHAGYQTGMQLAYWSRGGAIKEDERLYWRNSRRVRYDQFKWTLLGGITPSIDDIAFCTYNFTLYVITRPSYEESYKVIQGWSFKDKQPISVARIRIRDDFGDNYRLVQSLNLPFMEEFYVVYYDYLSRCIIYKLDSGKKVKNEETLLLTSWGDSISFSSNIDGGLIQRLFTVRKHRVHQASIVVRKIMNLS